MPVQIYQLVGVKFHRNKLLKLVSSDDDLMQRLISKNLFSTKSSSNLLKFLRLNKCRVFNDEDDFVIFGASVIKHKEDKMTVSSIVNTMIKDSERVKSTLMDLGWINEDVEPELYVVIV